MFLINIMIITIFGLNVIDYLQTIYMVDLFGAEIELNLLMRIFIKLKCVWLVKLVFIPMCLLWLSYVICQTGVGTLAVVILMIFFFIVVIHNFRVMKDFDAL